MKNFEEKQITDLQNVIGGEADDVKITAKYDIDDKFIGIDVTITPKKK